MKIFELINIRVTEMARDIKKYLSSALPNYETLYGDSTIFGQIINVMISITQNIILYIEDSLVEQNKYTAQRKKSIYGLAIQSGYIPSLGKATTCNVCLQLLPNNSNLTSIILPNKTKLQCSQNGLTYNILLPQESLYIDFSSSSLSHIIQVIQGEWEEQRFITSGGKLYTQHVDLNGDVDMDYVEVRVGGEKWEKRESLYDMDANGKQYYVIPSVGGGIDVMFGNGVYGRELKEEDVVDVSYIIHGGEDGNINVNDKPYFTFSDGLKDLSGEEVDGNELFLITLASENEVSGGTYSESTPQVKEMIGFNSRSLVLADTNNYKNLLNKFSFVGYNKTWSERGSLLVQSLVMKNYKLSLKEGKDYFSLTPSDFLLSPSQKESIKNHISMSGNQIAGITYDIVDPTLCRYALYLYLHMSNTSYDKLLVSSKIRDLVGEFFSNEINDFFIPKSDIMQLIKNNVEGVDGVDVYFLSERNEEAIKRGWYKDRRMVWDEEEGVYKVVEEKVEVEKGVDPGVGLDEHGNIKLTGEDQYPVLMGGWSYVGDSEIGMGRQEITITDPLIMVFD